MRLIYETDFFPYDSSFFCSIFTAYEGLERVGGPSMLGAHLSVGCSDRSDCKKENVVYVLRWRRENLGAPRNDVDVAGRR